MSVPQQKSIGAWVPFSNATEIKDLQRVSFVGDVVGLLAYQGTPITVAQTVRNTLFNGNINDVKTQIDGQGMTVRYGLISWNETLNNGQYLISDLRIGVVVDTVREYNTGPAYMIDALKAIPWLKQIMDMMSLPWKAWLLLTPINRGVVFHQFVEELYSDVHWITAPIGSPLPPLPTASSVKAVIESQADFQASLGKFTTEMLDRGTEVTVLGYGIDICFKKSNEVPIPGNARGFNYIVYTRFWWDCTTNPDIVLTETAGTYFAWTLPVIIAIIVAVGALFALNVVAYNLTHSSSWYRKYDANGNLIEEGGGEGPPDWWSFVVPLIALMGIGAGVYLILPYFRKGDKK